MSKNKCLHDGSKIYDTPRPGARYDVYGGYNYFCGCESDYPTKSVGSYCRYTKYWERQLFRELMTVLDFEVPKTWDKDYFLWVLFRCGYVALIKDPTDGVIPQYATLSRRGKFYQPTRATISNELIQRKRYTIGVDCAIIKLTPDYEGVWDIVHYYAETLGLISQSLRMAIVNTRVTDVTVAANRSTYETLKTIYEMTDEGTPTFVIPGTYAQSSNNPDYVPWKKIENNVGRNFLVDKYQAAIEDCLNEFRRRVGIPVMSDKKERQVENEVNTAIATALTSSDVWYDCLTRSIEIGAIIFPEIKNDLKVSKNQEVTNNAPQMDPE